MSESNEPVRYGYFKVKTKIPNRFGYITMAMIRPPKDRSNNEYTVGVSFCSPKDSFQKSLGRKIATGRLQARKKFNVRSSFSFFFNSTETVLSKAFTEALSGIVNSNCIAPAWVTRAYKRGDIQFGLSDNPKM